MDAELQLLIDEAKADALAASEDFAKKLAVKIPKALAIIAKNSETPIDDIIVAALAKPLEDFLLKLAESIKP